MAKPRRILCLDVGYRFTGYALWKEEYQRFAPSCIGVIETTKICASTAKDCWMRSQKIFRELSRIIHVFRPELIIGELPTGGAQNAKAMRGMALATAAVACAIENSHIKFIAVTPQDVKQMVDPESRTRKVDKEKVQRYVEARFGGSLLPKKKYLREHIADAMVCIDVLGLA